MKNGKISKYSTTYLTFQFSVVMGKLNGSKLPRTTFYNSQDFQQDQDHSIRNSDEGDTHSRSRNKNKEATTEQKQPTSSVILNFKSIK